MMFDFLSKLSTIQKAYCKLCEGLLIKYNIPKTSFDIIMFLANNKQYYTANAISEMKNIKPNVVSIHVEKLVSEGFIVRQPVDGDRRKVRLVCTEKSQGVIDEGRILQKKFFDALLDGLDKEELDKFKSCFDAITQNASKML